MNNTRTPRDRVLQILHRAFEAQEVRDDEPHIADDEELLACWESGLLSPTEHDQIVNHLAACPRCRRELAEMLSTGVLELPETTDEAPEDQKKATDKPTPPTPPKPPLQPRTGWVRLALAASVLAAIGGLAWQLSPGGPSTMLAQAERDLANGRAASAMEQAEQVLSRKLDPATQTKAQSLLQEAGYQAAKSGLSRKDFQQVLEVEHRVSSRAGESPRLLNLRLQAERGETAELSLAGENSLLQYGYEVNGRVVKGRDETGEKGLDQPTASRIQEELQQAAGKFPDDVILQLNRGQFLLKERLNREAAECFRAVVKKDEQNDQARLGLGLALFGMNQLPEALREFEAAVQGAPQDVHAQLNLAICLQQMGRKAEARAHYEQAGRLTTDPHLKEQIAAMLAP